MRLSVRRRQRTGLIKANVPSRIAFSVSSGVDSRTIIDMNGAEKLLGKGDMLFYPAGFPKPQRVQGAFVSDQEVQKVVDFLTERGMTADYNPEVEQQMNAAPAAAAEGGTNGRDEYFEQAGAFIIEKEKASIGMLQRMFKIGFNRAARIMDQLAEAGVVGERGRNQAEKGSDDDGRVPADDGTERVISQRNHQSRKTGKKAPVETAGIQSG